MKKCTFLVLLLSACATGTDTTTLSVTITASNATPAEGDRITVKAIVKGGVGDITYKWEQTAPKTPKVAFSGALLQETQVTVPGLCADTNFELKVTVEDADGKTASATTSFSVTNGNDALELRNVTVSKSTVVVGDLLTFTAEAVGPGCGPKFQWTQPTAPATGGYEGMTNAAQATWRAPEVPGTYNVQLVISDEAGAALPARDTMVTVQAPQYTRDIVPVLDAACNNCHDAGMNADPDPNAATCVGCLPLHLEGNKAAVQAELARTPSDPSCNTSPFLTAGNPAASTLWQRIELNPATPRPAGCDQMPRNNTGFFTTNKDLYIRMKVWIATAGDPFAQ